MDCRQDKMIMRKKSGFQFDIKTLLLLISIFCVLVIFFTALFRARPNFARKCLPASAVEVYEFSTTPPLYQLKAKVSPEDFEEFVLLMGLGEIEPRSKIWSRWVTSTPAPWFHSIDSERPSHLGYDSPSMDAIAKYKDGYLYYQCIGMFVPLRKKGEKYKQGQRQEPFDWYYKEQD